MRFFPTLHAAPHASRPHLCTERSHPLRAWLARGIRAGGRGRAAGLPRAQLRERSVLLSLIILAHGECR